VSAEAFALVFRVPQHDTPAMKNHHVIARNEAIARYTERLCKLICEERRDQLASDFDPIKHEIAIRQLADRNDNFFKNHLIPKILRILVQTNCRQAWRRRFFTTFRMTKGGKNKIRIPISAMTIFKKSFNPTNPGSDKMQTCMG
jgi:hypothetical protein